MHVNKLYHTFMCGPGIAVGIATGCGLDGPGIESRWGRDFPHLSRPALGPPSLLYNGYRVFPGVKSGRGVALTPNLLLVPWSWKGRAIPLLPLWPVRPVQSLSACTRVHFTFYLTPIYREEFFTAICNKNCLLKHIVEGKIEGKMCVRKTRKKK